MENNITFKEAIVLAENIIKRFDKIEGKPWLIHGNMIELMKQVGELSKLVMMQEGYYFSDRDKLDKQYETNKEKIADELADILYAIIRIASYYNLNLIDAHINARKAEDDFLKTRGV